MSKLTLLRIFAYFCDGFVASSRFISSLWKPIRTSLSELHVVYYSSNAC